MGEFRLVGALSAIVKLPSQHVYCVIVEQRQKLDLHLTGHVAAVTVEKIEGLARGTRFDLWLLFLCRPSFHAARLDF